jgi:hypothetical protein
MVSARRGCDAERATRVALRQTLEIYELLDRADADGASVAALLRARGLDQVDIQRIDGPYGHTDFLHIDIEGTAGGPTLGVVGRLGGVGARPGRIGLVSDADGAIVALAVALKLADMRQAGDPLPGRVIITTHVCPAAPTIPYEPVERMISPVDVEELIDLEVDKRMEAIVSIDATKANDIVNWKGIAITPTVKEGYVLRVAPGLTRLLASVTGLLPRVVPLTTQDITPHGNGVYHINSMLQPSTRTTAPVVGLATVAESAVPGSATGASHVTDLEVAVRFVIEVAKSLTAGDLVFHDPEEWQVLTGLYGSLRHLQGVRS